MPKLSLVELGAYEELDEWRSDRRLIESVGECIAAQRNAAADTLATSFERDETGGAPVSEAALREILASGDDVHGISRERHISNVIPFNARQVDDAVWSDEVLRLRRRVDAEVTRKIRETFGWRLVASNSGHFWYPPGGYMGWHTNSGFPGWRLYVTHAEDPGESFFRYRHPETHEIVTSRDHEWDFRLFRVSRDTLLWHAIYSETNRFSIGYVLRTPPLYRRVARELKKILSGPGAA